MHPLSQQIAALQRRLAMREYAVAVCRIAAAVIAAAIVLGALDYSLRLNDPGLRIFATASLAAVSIAAAYRWWYLPHRRLVPLAVARRVESHFPQLRDSLASAVEFLQQEEDDLTAGSPQLRRLVVSEAQLAVEGLPLDDVIDRKPFRQAATCLAAALLALGLCLAWDARAVGTAIARLAAPLGSAEWPRQHYLAFRDVPQRLAAGQAFEVELADAGGELPDEVRIEYRIGDGSGRQRLSEPMTRLGDVMTARRENVRQSFAFRAYGGDNDTMQWHWVEVVEPPQLEAMSITLHPPAYTALPPSPAGRHLEVLEGTAIEVRGVASEPLSTARILMDGIEPIAATITADADGREARALHIAPQQWIAERSGQYQLELADDDGVTGVVGQWNLRAIPDAPPSISWQRPNDDLYVVTSARVPIKLLTRDDLAIQRVALVYERSDRSEGERERHPTEPRVELYRGPEKPAPPGSTGAAGQGESRVIDSLWDLTPLELPVGAELSVIAEASDYRPGTGRTASARRITIVTADELAARLAQRQAQIVEQLERALAAEQATRDEIRRLEIQQQSDGKLTPGDTRALQTAELNQRRLQRMLSDDVEGVPASVAAVLAEIEMNRITGDNIRAALERLAAELESLAGGPLDRAGAGLTAARKAAVGPGEPNDDGQDQKPSQLLAAVGVAQEQIIATLERLVSELSQHTDYQRFLRLLSQLREDQIAHELATRSDIGVETLPLRFSELTRIQRTKLSQAAAAEQSLAARFEKIEQGMDRLAQELASREEQAEALRAAVDLARRLAIGSKMREAARGLSMNRVGVALAREAEIAEDLQRVFDVLRNQQEQPQQLAEELRDAETRLAALREQLGNLRERIVQVEKRAMATDDAQLSTLHEEQQKLRNDIEKLARQLEQLQAAEAGQSTRRAAARLNDRPTQPSRPSSSQEIAKAEQDLAAAADQLARQRQQAEDDLVLQMVRRFQAELAEMVGRQQRVIEQTVEFDRQRQSEETPEGKISAAAAELAGEERRLAELTREHSELLYGLGAVRVSLEDAERRLLAAAKLLKDAQTGPAAQQAEQQALARLKGMLEAFAQTAAEAGQNQSAQRQADAGGEQPQRRPTFELLEVKMLRMLQADLNDRTRDYEQRIAALPAAATEDHRAQLEREARDLAVEQGRLAELVKNMLLRDNEQ